MTSQERLTIAERALKRRVQGVFPLHDEVVARLVEAQPLTFYLGIDPTGPMHLGHTIPLLLLRDLQELGHKITVLIGDFTARLGDPTGKSNTRVALTAEEVGENMASYISVIKKILTPDEFRYNSEWYTGMSFEDVIRLTSRVTVQQMLARDMFQDRINNDKPIHVNEFLYPIMQGYDSVALRIDGEVGGNDQTFNMLVGREFEKELLGKDKIVLATYLLADPVTGKKMSKTEGTFIALEDTPQEMRRKVLALDDGMIAPVFRLCTRRDEEWIDGFTGGPREFKEELAAELIRMYHGERSVSEATQAVQAEATGVLYKVLKEIDVASSTTTAKALIDQGGVEVNGQKADRWDIEIKSGDVIKVGKGKVVQIK